MESFRVKNFKSISNLVEINIKPITVFVGKNGSGKSSLLRVLPLLKQSFETNRVDQFLWYGEHVDFGDFTNVLPIYSSENYVNIGFSLQSSKNLNRYYYYYIEINDESRVKNFIRFDIDFFLSKNNTKILIKFLDQQISLKLLNGNISELTISNFVFDKQYLKNVSVSNGIRSHSLFPYISIVKEDKRYNHDQFVFENLIDYFSNLMVRKVSKQTLRNFLSDSNSLYSKVDFLNHLKRKSDTKTINTSLKNLTIDSSEFEIINSFYILSKLQSLFECLNRSFENNLSNLSYIKPIRASANRFYRNQGVGVQHVDGDGANLPIILNNMSDEEILKFSDWCKSFLGVGFSVEKQTSLISIMVETDKEHKINLADTGYGYSQILPIMLELWLLQKNNIFPNKTYPLTIIIEQPELHLHPALQSKFAEIVCDLVTKFNKNDIKINFIIETHSDFFLNKLGSLVSKKMLNNNEVNLVLTSKINNETIVKQTKFDNEGYIKEWPIGFMSAE